MSNEQLKEQLIRNISSSIVLFVKDGWDFKDAVANERVRSAASATVFKQAVEVAKQALA